MHHLKNRVSWSDAFFLKKHLFVLGYGKEIHSEDVVRLEVKVDNPLNDAFETQESTQDVQVRPDSLRNRESLIDLNVRK